MKTFNEIDLRVYRSVNGLNEELGKLSKILEKDDNIEFFIDDENEYINIETVVNTINTINKNLDLRNSWTREIGTSVIKFLALMKIFKCREQIPKEFLYNRIYTEVVKEHSIEKNSKWFPEELELIKFRKDSPNSIKKEVHYLFARETKKITQQEKIEFSFDSSGYIIIKNVEHLYTDTSEYKVIAYENKVIITEIGDIPLCKIVNVGEDVVKSTTCDNFETVDYHKL